MDVPALRFVIALDCFVIAIVLLLNGFRICWSALAMSDQMLDSMLGDIVHSSAFAYRVLPKG